MTDKEKQLLLIDLSARLTYGVVVNYKENEHDVHRWEIRTLYAPSYSKNGSLIDTDHDGWIGYTDYEGSGMSTGSRPLHLDKMLPYLRPMSSMTSQEWCELCDCNVEDEKAAIFIKDGRRFVSHVNNEAFLNSHHFDYRGLIPMGLAIEAPKDMYKIK